MTRLAILLLLLCPAAALSADNPLLGRWRTCLVGEELKMRLELEFHEDGTVRHSETTYAKRGCTSPLGPTRSRMARYSFVRINNSNTLSFEFSSDPLGLRDDEEAWLSGTFTFMSNDTMSFRLTDIIMMHGGKPVLISPEESPEKSADVFSRIAGPRLKLTTPDASFPVVGGIALLALFTAAACIGVRRRTRCRKRRR